MIKIAGRQVRKGDRLYNMKMQAWGTVMGFDPSGPAIAVFPNPPYQPRKVYVQNGGVVGNKQQVFWHEPLSFNAPVSDTSFAQKVVDVLQEQYEN